MQRALLGLSILAMSSMAVAKPSLIFSVFYDSNTTELTVNTVSDSGRSGFIRTNRVVLVTKDISLCQNGCLASLADKTNSSFSVVVDGKEIATVETNDPENLLHYRAFDTIELPGRDALVLKLDILRQDSVAKVK